jgi:hypothetical protein
MTRQTLARRLKIFGGGLLAAGLLFLLAQFLIRWGADYYLRERAKIPVHIGSLFINPATSRVSISLAGEKPGQVLNLDLGAVRFDWWTVFLKRLRVGHVNVQGLNLSVVRDAAGHLTVGDIPLAMDTEKPSATPPQAQTSSGKPWGVGEGGVDLHDLHLDYRDPLVKLSVVIEKFHMDPAESWRPDAQTPFEGDITVNGGRIHLSGTCRPFRTDPTLDTRIQVTAMPLAWLGPAIKRPGLDGNIDATLVLDGLEVHPSSGTPTVKLKQLEISNVRLAVDDRSTHPAFRWKAQSVNLKLSDINTADPAAVVPFSFNALISRYEKIALSGHWTPFGKVPDGHLDLKVDGFNLTPFTPFAENAVGYRVATGLVDLKTKVDVKKGLLEANNNFVAHKFHLEKLKSDELDPSASQIGLPLNLCLALLRDADDNIRLDVPVSGDLNDPSLPIGKLVWQILGKALAAAMRAAASAFFPSGKLGFDPVVFAPGTATLSPEATVYLAKVGENLSKRPEVGIKLSGLAVAADYYALKKKKMPEPPVPLDPTKISAADNDKLLALAAQRADALRNYLSETGHIDPKRLPATAPQLDLSPMGNPRAELSL